MTILRYSIVLLALVSSRLQVGLSSCRLKLRQRAKGTLKW